MSPPNLKALALLSLAPALLPPTHAATTATDPSTLHQYNYNPDKIFASGPLTALLIPGSSFLPSPALFNSTTFPVLPASCYNCNAAGCMCSAASLLSLNNTDVGQLVNVCEVCRDAPWGMVCFCAEDQWTASHACGSDEGKSAGPVDPKTGDICRLSGQGAGKVLAGRTNVYAPGVTITPGSVQVGGAGPGTGSKSGAGKVAVGGVVVAAVLGAGAAMGL